ncbi:LysM peptidoglycan-binding domain-containing protein [Vibrio chagasii]|uniref:LysM peptidoglycan-binding domain-containing protein n=1 Tax=Vibrio chagasii TaxID=170679 RepID=UPI003734EF92
MNRLISNIIFICCFLNSGSTVAENSTSHILGVGANYGYNFDGDMYDNSQSLYFIYKYNRLQLNLGIKHYKLLDNSEYIPDLGLLYSIHDGDALDFKVGVGIEDKYPTIEYVVDYAVNSTLGVNVAFNQVLNDDFGQNQREVVVGFSYLFFDTSRINATSVIEIRPNDVAADPITPRQIQVDKDECRTDIDKKPKLPYVVKEGDWLYKLHRDYDFDLEEIMKNNDIKDPNIIFPGQVLE